MEKIINTTTWVLSGVSVTGMILPLIYPTNNPFMVFLGGFLALVMAGIVYYGGYLILDIRNNNRNL